MSKKDKKKKKQKKNEYLSTDFGTGLSRIEKIDLGETVVEEKKKTQKRPDKITGPATYEEMLRDAENLEGYLTIMKDFAILKNLSPKKYKEAVKTVEELVSLLREGKGKNVYNQERYDYYMERINSRGF